MKDKLDKLTEASKHVEPAEATKDNVFKELAERESRKSNIIIYGLKESTSNQAEERKGHDKTEVDKVIGVLKVDSKEDDIKVMYRTGEREKVKDNSEPRPLVIGFRNNEIQTSISAKT